MGAVLGAGAVLQREVPKSQGVWLKHGRHTLGRWAVLRVLEARQFLLSTWQWLPPLVCSTPRSSLWTWCCLKGGRSIDHLFVEAENALFFLQQFGIEQADLFAVRICVLVLKSPEGFCAIGEDLDIELVVMAF